MNALMLNTAAGLLVSAYLLAGANLIRVMVREGREDKRSRQRRRLRQGSTGPTPRTSTRGARLAAAGLLTFLPTAALAQSSDAPPPPAPTTPAATSTPLTISTDRPSFSDGTGIQPLWHLNLETGYTFTHRDRDGVETNRQNGPEMLARIGLIEDRLEFRIIWSGYVDTETDSGGTSSSANGLSDITIGLKASCSTRPSSLTGRHGWRSVRKRRSALAGPR